MKNFKCPSCKNQVFFENVQCENCGNHLAFSPKSLSMVAYNQKFINTVSGEQTNLCSNNQLNTCNWILTEQDHSKFCIACNLNRTIPNLSDSENYHKWVKLEKAKHRLVFQLLNLGLPISRKSESNFKGLCFDFLSENNAADAMTGHAEGVITILLPEADSVHLERMKRRLSEPYRTLLGHFRHEVGHYYWNLLIKDSFEINAFREFFGDERADYSQALQHHYQKKQTDNWKTSYISDYASSHPWEDWAETWAHYLHIMDTFETCAQNGLETNATKKLDSFQVYKESDFKNILDSAIPTLTVINSVNRSMGLTDIYPFVMNKAVIQKLHFIHNLLYKFRS